jgi:predicted transcriptional regulator
MTKHSRIIEYIKSLEVGARISVRSVAESMEVSEGTAYRAIKAAEADGLVSSIPRIGTVRLNTEEEKDIKSLTFAEALNMVEGNLLAGREGLHKYLNNFIIGAMTPDVAERYLENNDLLIVGNREEMFNLALDKNCAVLITGGFDCSDEIKSKANAKKLPVMNCSYDTFTVATLINNAINSRMVKKDIVLVEDILVKDPYVLNVSDSVGDWRRLVRETSHTRYPVVDDDGRLVGIVTAKDVASQEDECRIDTLMTTNPITVGPKASVAYTAHVMVWEGIEILPVLDDRRLLGIVSRQDVIKALHYRKNQPQVGRTMEETLLDSMEIEETKDGIKVRGRIESFMLNSIGTGSWGALAALISLAAGAAIRKAKGYECFINTLTVYYSKPVQLGDFIEVAVRITELGRNSCNMEVTITEEGHTVMKAIMSASYIKR